MVQCVALSAADMLPSIMFALTVPVRDGGGAASRSVAAVDVGGVQRNKQHVGSESQAVVVDEELLLTQRQEELEHDLDALKRRKEFVRLEKLQRQLEMEGEVFLQDAEDDLQALLQMRSESIHTHIHTYTYTHTHTHMHIHIHTHVHIHTHIHTHTNTHKHTHTHSRTNARTHTHTRRIMKLMHEKDRNTGAHTHSHSHSLTHTRAHTRTHTHTHKRTHTHTCRIMELITHTHTNTHTQTHTHTHTQTTHAHTRRIMELMHEKERNTGDCLSFQADILQQIAHLQVLIKYMYIHTYILCAHTHK